MSYEKVTQVRSRLIIGVKQTIKSMKKGLVSEVIVASDADQQIIETVVDEADELGIPVRRVDSMKKLGTACGIEVGASAVAIKNH